MIFVTVGNATQGFRRLLDAADKAAQSGVFGNEPVFLQTGNNPNFRSSHCQQEAFLQMERFEEMLRTSSLIISHGGAGTLLQVLRAGKVPIVMPRRRRYREHVDDHQVELVKSLAAEGRLIPAYEPEDLPAAIEQARAQKVNTLPASTSQLIDLLAEAISDLDRQKARK